eukprot:scaffold284568_cov18-Prasinocladus_malaysianus.AAC.1
MTTTAHIIATKHANNVTPRWVRQCWRRTLLHFQRTRSTANAQTAAAVVYSMHDVHSESVDAENGNVYAHTGQAAIKGRGGEGMVDSARLK